MFDGDAILRKRINQLEHFCQRFGKRRELSNLRADVAIDANNVQCVTLLRVLVELAGEFGRYAKLVFAQTGRDVRVRFGIYFRVNAQRYRRRNAQQFCSSLDAAKLGGAFHIEAAYFGLERKVDLIRAFADT